MSKILFLVRHAEVEHETPWRFRGQGDRPLSGRGRLQAVELGEALKGQSLDALYCSPLARCRETLAPLARAVRLEPRTLDDLAEINLGEWEGLSVAEVRSRFPGSFEARGADLAGFRPQGGESFDDLRGRASRALAFLLAQPGSRILAMTHGGVIRVLVCEVLGLPTDRVFQFELARPSVSCLAFDQGRGRVCFLNMGAKGALAEGPDLAGRCRTDRPPKEDLPR